MNKEGEIVESKRLKSLCKYCDRGWEAEKLFYGQAQISKAYRKLISHHYVVIKLIRETTMYVKAQKSFCPTGISVCIARNRGIEQNRDKQRRRNRAEYSAFLAYSDDYHSNH